MLTVAQIDFIKERYEVEDLSISEVARRAGVSWPTAKKYLDSTPESGVRPQQVRKKRVMLQDYQEIILAWLEEDQLVPRKQRRTAERIYTMLKEQTDFVGSDRTVRHYVSKLKKQLKNKHEDYTRLEHPPARAQVDFGEYYVLQDRDGRMQFVKKDFLLLVFPYSNAIYVRTLPSTNTECFLHGLASIFEELNGAPQEIWLDNLKPAVKKVLKGPDRQLSESFMRFKTHYRFEAKFCGVAKGNEKGTVEVDVGYVRRNVLTPVPTISEDSELSLFASSKVEQFRQKQHYRKGKQIAELHELDIKNLLALPSEPYETCSSQVVKTRNKYGEIKVGDHLYKVPGATPRDSFFLKVFWDRIEVFNIHCTQKITTLPRVYMNKTTDIDWAGVLEIYRNKPRAIEDSSYLKALPKEVLAYLLPPEYKERRSRVNAVLGLLERYDIAAIAKAAKTALETNRTDEASIVNIASYQAGQDKHIPPMPENITPQQAIWRPDFEKYSQLQQEVPSR